MFTRMVQWLCSVSIIARVSRINNRVDASAFLLTPYAGSNNNPLFHKNRWSVRSPENAYFFQSTPFWKVLNMLFVQGALFKETKQSFNSFKNTIDGYDGIYWKDLLISLLWQNVESYFILEPSMYQSIPDGPTLLKNADGYTPLHWTLRPLNNVVAARWVFKLAPIWIVFFFNSRGVSKIVN